MNERARQLCVDGIQRRTVAKPERAVIRCRVGEVPHPRLGAVVVRSDSEATCQRAPVVTVLSAFDTCRHGHRNPRSECQFQ